MTSIAEAAEDAALRTYSRVSNEIEDWYDGEFAKLRSAYEAKVAAADEACEAALRSVGLTP